MKSASELLSAYRDFTAAHRALEPVFSKLPLPQQQHKFQYVGGQLLGRTLCAVVNSAQRMLRLDTGTGAMDFVGEFDDADFKWTGGCVWEGKFYAFPRVENSMLIYDPAEEGFSRLPCEFTYPKEHHYGGVCTAGGIVYQPPRNSDHILRWDLRTGRCRKLVINGGQPGRYCGSVIHPDGSVWFIPERDFPVLRMDPRTEELTPVGGPVTATAFNPVVLPDGNIYGFRCDRGLVRIDTAAGRVDILHSNLPFKAYGTKPGLNGKLYSLPGYCREVWEFDPLTGQAKVCFRLDKDAQVQSAGGPVDRSGDCYALPVYADHVLKIGFGHHGVTVPEELYQAFFRNFY